MKFIQIDGATVLKIEVKPDRRNIYQSPSTKPADQPKNILRTHVRKHASAIALEGIDLINWSKRREANDE